MTDCGICLEEVSSAEVVLKCNHKFCLSCFDKWAEKNETRPKDMANAAKIINCPTCRRLYFRPINQMTWLKSTECFHYKNIICKVILKRHYHYLIEPMQIFTFACKNQIFKKNGVFHFDRKKLTDFQL